MAYVIGVYDKFTKRKLGYMLDDNGRIIRFENKIDATTYKNIESTQMESEYVFYRVLKEKKRHK